MTATRFIGVYEMSKSNKLLDLNVPVSGLYALAAPSTPDEARAAVIERAERKAGQLLKKTVKQHGARGVGKKVELHSATPLSKHGISRDISSRWQKLAVARS